MSIYEMLRARWLEAGIEVNEGVPQGVLDRFEQKHRVSLPRDFREYLLTVNGMKPGQTDENLVSFLALEVIDQTDNVKELSADLVELVFAEFCIYSHSYVLRTPRSGEGCVVIATDGKHEKQIAESFEQFIRQYLDDPVKIAYCW